MPFLQRWLICFGQNIASRMWSLPSTQLWWSHTHNAGSHSGVSSTRDADLLQRLLWRARRGMRRQEHLCLTKTKGWESWGCSVWRKEGSGGCMYQYICIYKIAEGRVQGGHSQILCCGYQRQWAHTETQKVSSEYQERIFHSEHDQALP